MRLRRLTLWLCCAASALATCAMASEDATQAEVTLASYGNRQVPAREAIKSLARQAGLVIIFDGRKVQMDRRVTVDPRAKPKDALERVLATMELQLKPVSANTYAITGRETAPGTPVLSVKSASSTLPLMDTILVTGIAAAITQDGHETSIVEIDEDTIQLLSEARVSDVIFDLPQALASFSSANTTLYGATAGLNLADLRGLGPERTQVLINGRRRTPFSGGNGTVFAVDLTTLPHSFVRQIEVLDYSQSVAVGPEAMAGSVNLVLDSRPEGIEAGTRYGLSEQGDAQQLQTYANIGTTFAGGRGTFFAAIEIANEEGLKGGDRELTAQPYGFAEDGRASISPDAEFLPGFMGSTTNENGLIGAVILEDGSRVAAGALLESFAFTGTGSLEPFEWRLDQLYNWAEAQSRILPNERVVGFLSAEYEVDDTTHLFAELHAGVSGTDATLSPLPAAAALGGDPLYGNGFPIRLDNPIIPDEISAQVLAATGGMAQEIVLTQRLTALGLRESRVDRDYLEIILGGSHRLSDLSMLNMHYRYGNTTVGLRSWGLANRERLQTALSETACAQVTGCVPINPFVPGGVEAGADFISAISDKAEISITEHELYTDFATEYDIGLQDPLSVLYGISWRHSEASTSGDTGMSENIGSTNLSITDGWSETAEIFARGTVPVFNEASPIGAVRLGGGARGVHTTHTGWTQNAEGFADWSPSAGITLRGVAAYGERPPNLAELFFRDAGSYRTVDDPCSGIEAGSDSILAQNCLSAGPLGVTAGYEQSGALTLIRTYGNQDLDPETVQNWRADLIFEPHLMFGVDNTQSRLRLSYTDTKLKGVFETSAASLADCYMSVNFAEAGCGDNSVTGLPLIQRDPVTGELTEFGSELVNGQTRSTKSVDLELRLSHQPDGAANIDRMWLTALHTHLLEVEDQDIQTGTVTDQIGGARYPRDRTLVAAGIDAGPHQFALQGNRRSAVRAMNRPLDLAKIDPVTTLDIAWRYDLSDNTRFTAKISNVTDELPNRAAYTHGLNVLAEHYDIVGRRFSAEIEFQF